MAYVRRFRVSDGTTNVSALLNESVTADEVWDALPFTGRAQFWGDEIYFSIPVSAELAQGATDVVEAGTVAYWPPGNAMCLFWGPTPASHGDECRAASPVNVIGKIEGEPCKLASMTPGSTLTISQLD